MKEERINNGYYLTHRDKFTYRIFNDFKTKSIDVAKVKGKKEQKALIDYACKELEGIR